MDVIIKKIVAVEEELSNSIKDALEKEGYFVVRAGPAGAGENVDATIVSGMDNNMMGMQDIMNKAPVIDASGKTTEEILSDLKKRI